MLSYSKAKKSILSFVLVMAILLSNLSIALSFGASATDPEKLVSKTDGAIVAGNYTELSEAEQKLISSGYLIGSTHNYKVPGADDELVSVDSETKVISADEYEGTSGYVWVPVSADITVSDRVEETVNFTSGKATYTYGGDAFAVKVKYELKLTVDETTQKELLNAPAYLQQALALMDTLVEVRDDLAVLELQQTVDALKELNTIGIPVSFGLLNGTVVLKDQKFGDAVHTERDAVNALLEQYDANSGKYNLSVLVDEYNNFDSKVQYLVENTNRLKQEIKNTYDYIYAISRDNGSLKPIYSMLEGSANTLTGATQSMFKLLETLLNTLDGIVETLATINAEDAFLLSTHKVVADGLDTTAYQAFDTLALALGDATLAGSSVTVKNPLVVDTAVVQFNMAMFDVSVKVVLNVADGIPGSTNLTEYGSVAELITLVEGATKTDIEDAVGKSGVVDKAVASWGGVYSADNFEATYSVLPETLTEDVTYVITYSPKNYSLDYLGNKADVPYGYVLQLEKHDDAAKAYDYTVNGNYRAEGTYYTVVSDTIVTRAEGKSYVNYVVNNLVAKIYFADDAKATAILTSGALNVGNEVVSVRVPDNKNNIVTLDEDERYLTAEEYPSSYNGLDWVPYSYTVVSGTEKTEHKFDGATTVEINESSFDYVDVVYRLSLVNLDDAEILKLAGLPYVLVKEADEQKKILDTFGANISAMAQVTRATLGAIEGVVDNDTEMDPEIREKLLATIVGIMEDCFDGNDLKIYKMMSEYNDPNNGGLRYYYLNSAAVINEINILAGYLNDLLGEGDNTELKDALVELVESVMPGQSEKIDSLDKVKEQANKAAAIAAPNAAINLENTVALGKLADALVTEGDVANIASVEALYIDATPITKESETVVTVGVTITMPGNEDVKLPTAFDKNHVLTQQDVEKIVDALDDAVADLNVDDRFYDTNYDKEEILALAGQKASEIEKTQFDFTWTPKEFTVEIEGADDETVTIDNLEITLPSSSTQGVRYEYMINGVKVNPGVYKFTLDEIVNIFTNGKYSITRNEIDVSEEDLRNFVNDLNAAVGNDGIVFALTKSAAGEYSVIMKVNGNKPQGELVAAIKGMVTELATSYSYIAFDDNAIIYPDGGTKISIQAIIEAVMASGIGNGTITSAIDANGNINNMALPGVVVSDKAMAVAGGKLALVDLALGDSAAAVHYSVPMYITLGSAPAIATQLRNLLANQLAPYFSFVCEDGRVNVNVNLPKKAYEAYLAVLLASGYADITDVNSLNEDVVIGFVKDIIDPLVNSDASVQSIQNTLAKFGYNINLVKYEKAFEYIRKIYKEAEFNYNDVVGAYDVKAEVSINGLLDRLNIPAALKGMIAEDKLSFELAVNLDNLDKNYEALFFDIGAEGVLNKFGLVEDAAAKTATLSGTSVVILLSDVDGDLVFNTTAVLNLNGYTVDGNVTGNKSLRIIDTNINAGAIGEVTGAVSGNVKIAGGKYAADVSAFITDGYTQGANGVVANDFFEIVKDENGDISIEINAGMLATNKLPDVATLAVDIVAELLVNGYTANKLYVDGNKVYEITIEDLVGIYTGTDRVNTVINELMDGVSLKDLKTLANTILSDVTDFDALRAIMDANIENGAEDPLLTYALTTGSWGFSVDYMEDDDSISASVTSGNEKNRNLNIVVTGKNADKQHFANLLGILADTTDASLVIENVSGGKVSGGFNFNIGVSGDVKVDLTSDPKYAILLGVLVADGIGSSENAELVAGLKACFEANETRTLANAFNNLTVAQIVKAIKKLQRTDSFAKMLTDLGLDGYDVEDAKALEAEVGAFAKALAILVRRVNIDGTGVKLGSLIDSETGAYTFDKESIKRSVSATVAGYTFTVNAELVDAFASLNIFGEIVLVDYTELEKQIEIANGKNEEIYSEKTWADLEEALAAANEALNSKDQAVVDKAAEDLKNAIAALADITSLEKVIADAEQLDESEFSEKTWNALEDALVDAKDALVNGDKQTVADAEKALTDALAALADVTELKEAIANTESLVEENYTESSWKALEDALEAAEDALVNGDKAAVEVATADLKAASEALVNVVALKEAIASTEDLDEADYSEKTWKALEDALAAAEEALVSGTEKQVADAIDAIDAAVEALADINDLKALIEEAKKYNEDEYTSETWVALADAIVKAEDALVNGDKDTVTKAYNDLKTAIEDLEKKPVVVVIDYEELKKQIAKAEEITDSSKYTKKTWDDLQAALAAGKDALDSTSQSEVNEAALAIKRAIEALADVTELREQLEIAAGKVQSAYTAETWKVLADAVDNANKVLENGDKAAVEAATKALKDAIAGLRAKPSVTPSVNYDDLKALIAQAEALNAEDYTEESWANLTTALNAAKEALNSKNQKAVDDAAAALKAAIEALEAIPEIDYSALQALIAEAEALKEDDYTKESWKALEEALEAAKAALTATSQADVDKAAADLKAAIEALEEVSGEINYDELKAQIEAAEALNKDDYTEESWADLETALEAAKEALTATSQDEVDKAAADLKAAIEALVKVEGSSNCWIWILILVLVLLVIAIVVIFIIMKKKKNKDNTPLVDYDIADDN